MPAAPSFKVLTLEDFPATQVSRKKNAELREAALRSDPLIGRVEPDRVFCSVCCKWILLRRDSVFGLNHWLRHRDGCWNKQCVFRFVTVGSPLWE